MGYEFGILRTDKSSEAIAHNAQLLGKNTLGIEVTLGVLAGYCGLGNIDPQHSNGGRSSAIETAFAYDVPLGLKRLVTVRADKDSLGAMAVFALRCEGKRRDIDPYLVEWIGALDRGPYRNARRYHPELANMFNTAPKPTEAMNAIVWQKISLAEKVSLFGKILIGEMSKADMTLLCEQIDRPDDFVSPPKMFGEVAFFYAPGQYREAREYGNKNFGVAVILDPERKTESGGMQRRWCIVRQVRPHKVFDRAGFEKAINLAEANARDLSLEELRGSDLEWGGPPNLVVSPPGAGNDTRLSNEEIIEMVRKHLESGVVT